MLLQVKYQSGRMLLVASGMMCFWLNVGAQAELRSALPEGPTAKRLSTVEAAYPVTIDALLATPSWTAESDLAGAWFGYSVAAAGDVNSDGYGDVIVGAREYDHVGTMVALLGSRSKAK